jgi:hypothetical protein
MPIKLKIRLADWEDSWWKGSAPVHEVGEPGSSPDGQYVIFGFSTHYGHGGYHSFYLDPDKAMDLGRKLISEAQKLEKGRV